MDKIRYPLRIYESRYTVMSCGIGCSNIEEGIRYEIMASDDRRIATVVSRSIADEIIKLLNNKEE